MAEPRHGGWTRALRPALRLGAVAALSALCLGGACGPREPSAPAAPPAAPDAPAAKPAPAVAPPAPVKPPPAPEQVLAYDEADPLGDLESADGLERPSGRDLAASPAPDSGCTLVDGPRQVWKGGNHPVVVGAGAGFALAGYAAKDGVEHVFLVELDAGGGWKPITSFPVPVPHPREREAGPGLAARNDEQVLLALTDGKGALHVREVELGKTGPGALRSIASGADTRFAPAIAHVGEHALVAWTEGSTPMRTRVAVLDRQGKIRKTHDVTPSGSGAAAPAFVAGASPPSLLTVDARDGLSPVSQVDFAPDGSHGDSRVAVPVGMVSTPPQLAAASSAAGTYLGYTGLGSAATSAVGLVVLAPVQGSPEALVPGTAYGRLHVAAVDAPRAVLIAADTPTQPGKDAPRQVRVHVVTPTGRAKALALAGPDQSASQVSIARNERGVVAVAFVSAGAVQVAQLRCADD